MTAECDKCGLVKRDVRLVEHADGLRMMCMTCAPGRPHAEEANSPQTDDAEDDDSR